MAAAHAVRPRQHCRAVEIERRDAMIDALVQARIGAADREGVVGIRRGQSAWAAAIENDCGVLARESRGSLGSEKAQVCRLDAQEKRLDALGRPLGS